MSLLLLPKPVRGNDAAGTEQGQEIIATGGIITSILAAPVVGQPYTAVQAHSTTRTLADGSTISHHGHHFIARDSEGRVHVELRMARGHDGSPDEVMVFVMDPVAHTLTTWIANAPAQVKIASVFKIPMSGQNSAPPPSQTMTAAGLARPQAVVTSEDLGTKSIQGLEAAGKRTTTTIPVGESGNSAPITHVHEVWTSTLLQLVLEQHWTDPRSGEKTVELEHISRANPGPALFQPPSGYEVKGALESLKDLEQKLSTMQQ